MKRFYAFIVILITLNCWLSIADAQIVRMPDANLAAVVRDALGLAPNATITRQDMQRLTFLNAQSYKIEEITGQRGEIKDLTGLELATQLTRLWLNGNSINDIRPLAGLTQLEELLIWNNQITDITTLARLPQLQELGIGGNPIHNFQPLARLTQLRDLSITVSRISDIRSHVDLTQLELLDIWGTGSPISDHHLLGSLTQLIGLTIRDAQISDLSFLRGLTQLKWLSLEGNQIRDLQPLTGLTQLEGLYLWGNEISDLKPLAGLTQLDVLTLSYNEISDLKPLAGLMQLSQLILSNNRIRDVSPLAGLIDLRDLYLRNNPIQDASPLANLPNLRYTDIPIPPQIVIRNEIPDELPEAGKTLKYRVQIRNAKEVTGFSLTYSIPHPLTAVTSVGWFDRVNHVSRSSNHRTGTLTASGLETGQQIHNVAIFTLRANFAGEGELRVRGQLTTTQGLVNIDIRHPITIFPADNTGVTRNTDTSGGSAISIPDRQLASAVRKALGLGANARITDQEMRGLTRLDARDSGIGNLTGLEHATQLTGLFLNDNQIRNLNPISELTQLKHLGLDGNQISNIRPISGLTQLELLHIGQNEINNAGVRLLTKLKQLKWLALHGNQISNITPLAKLTKLEGLWIGSNKIRDVSPLSGLVNLQTLHLNGNPIQDFSPLVSLTKLTDVDIEIPRTPVPTTGTWLAVDLPHGLTTIKPGEFAVLVHRGERAVTGGIDFNDYYHQNPQNAQTPDIPNLARFFENGGRIELFANIWHNPSPPDSKEPQFGDVVISEIMWGLDGSAPRKQYIELYNASTHPYTFIDGNLALRFSTTSEAPLPNETFPFPFNPNAHVKVIDRVSNKGWKMPGKSGNTSQNKPLISTYRAIDYSTRQTPDGTIASSWHPSTGRVNLSAPSYGTPGAKDLPPTPVVQVESPEHAPMYWVNTDSGTLHRLIGTEVENLLPNVQNATHLAIDVASEELYWTEQTGNTTGRIRRANLDGTNVQLVRNLTSVPHNIALDTANGKIYLTNAWGKIQSLNVDGSNFQPNLITDLDTPKGITLDVSEGKVYWIEMSGRIRRANLNGSNIQNVATGLATPMNLVFHGGTVYWTEKRSESSGEIRSVNLNGNQNIVTHNTFLQGFPVGIAVDAVEQMLYWTTSHGEIGRVRLDGSNLQPNFVTGLGAPGTFAVAVKAPEILATDAVLSISPSSVISPAIGEKLTLNLNIAGGETVAGYQVTLQFDPTALRYVESRNGDYLPTGAFFVPPVVNRDRVELASSALTGVSKGDGTLATVTFEVIVVKTSKLILSETLLADSQGNTFRPQVEEGEITEPPELKADVNADGVVNIQDLVLVASRFGRTGQNSADVNGDGVINIADLVLVAGALGTSAGAPSLNPGSLRMLTAADVHEWLSQASQLNSSDIGYRQGLLVLEQLLAALTPKETVLLPNYPNPFNPETWIPYQLAKASDVKITIYDTRGVVVRQLELGHQPPGFYTDQSRAAYWDGRNALGERVASGIYFYQLQTDNVSLLRKMLILK